MHHLHYIHHVKKAGIFISLIYLVMMLGIPNALTQTSLPSPQTINGIDLFRKIENGNLSIKQGAVELKKIGVELPDGNKILQDLVATTGIDTEAAGKLIGGLGNKLDQIKDVKSLVNNFKKGNFDPEVANKILKGVGLENISPKVGTALGAYSKLNQLKNLKLEDFGDFVDAAGISHELAQDFNIDIKNIAPKEITKKIEKLSKEIEGVTSLLKNIKNIKNLPKELAKKAVEKIVNDATEKIVDGIINSLSPDAKKALQKILGPDLKGALQGNVVGGILNGLGLGSNTPAGGACEADCDTCKDCAPKINLNHQRIRAHITSEFEQHRIWMVTNFFLDDRSIAQAMATMATQLTTAGVQQVQIIGSFFDAKHQLETQRLFQTLTAKAHKDYHPSENLCEIGTNVRSLAGSERKSNFTHIALSQRMMDRQNSSADTIASGKTKQDRISRRDQFIEKFCNKTDHGNGLSLLCENSGQNPTQINMDIDYTNSFDQQLTLKLDLQDGTASTEDEENIFALSANLFANEVLPVIPANTLMQNGEPTTKVNDLLDLRAIAAKRSVAQNSFAAIAALKTQGDNQAAPFLKSILAEAGIAPDDIEEHLGEKPSYYAQMEVLTKNIFQNPTFYSNLYDKPVNIERKSAALLSLELMQDRDIYKSLLRSEAVLATLVEVMIQEEHDIAEGGLDSTSSFGAQTKETAP